MPKSDWLSDSKTGVIAAWFGWTVAILIALFASWEVTAPILSVGNYQADEIQCRRQQEERAAKLYPAAETDDEQARKKAAAEREKEAREYCVQRRSAVAGERQGDVARWAAVVSFLALLAASAAVYAGFRTVRTMQGTAVAQLRAYVHHNGMRWVSHTNPDGTIVWRLRPRWNNSGSTPTRHLSVKVGYWLEDALPGDDFVFGFKQAEKSLPAMLSPGGLIEGAHWIVNGKDLRGVKEKKKELLVWGVATYRDVFEGEHITRFCVHAIAVTGDPEKVWHADNNPVDILFATYHQHNCADDECDSVKA